MSNWTNSKRILLGTLLIAAAAFVSLLTFAPNHVSAWADYATKIYLEQGGARQVVASGGEVQVQSGGTLLTQSGALVKTTDGVGAVAGTGVTVTEYGNGILHKTVFTLQNAAVTLTLNGTSTAGGGLKIYDFPAGLILPLGATTDLIVAAAGDGSFLAALGSDAADTGGTLTSAEIAYAPSTAATVSSGVGTCKMKSTVLAPIAGTPLDGTSTAKDLYLNACLNADGTGKATLTAGGSIVVYWLNLGDN